MTASACAFSWFHCSCFWHQACSRLSRVCSNSCGPLFALLQLLGPFGDPFRQGLALFAKLVPLFLILRLGPLQLLTMLDQVFAGLFIMLGQCGLVLRRPAA